ncbi:glycosyl transferase, partial [Verrucomicrobiota bacterium]
MPLVKILTIFVWKVETALCWFLPDRLCLNYQYFRRHLRFINWKNPKTFNQKLQWLKLNYHPEILHQLCDKYDVRAYVQENVGEETLVPVVGV